MIAVLAFCVVPLGALVWRAAGDWRPPDGVLLPTGRQWALIGKTVALAASGVVATMLLSLPGAYAVGRIDRIARAPLRVALILLPLLLPPMVLSFGWQRLWGGYAPGMQRWGPLLRCVWVWASWAWPIPALMLGAGWSRVGRGAYESALLVSGGRSAFLRAVVPSLRRYAMFSAVVLFAVFIGEYAVPHANGIVVAATELLVYAQSASMADCLRLSLPIMGMMVALLASAVLLWPTAAGQPHDYRRMDLGQSPAGRILVPILVTATSVLPIVILAARATLATEIGEAFDTYRGEFVGTTAVCLGVGGLVTLMGVAVVGGRRRRWLGIGVATVFGVLPGAMVGEAVLAAYQRVPFVYEYWPIVVIGLSARFAWIGVLVAWLAAMTTPGDVVAQASADGADVSAARFSLQLRTHWALLLAGGFITAAMAMGDVAVVGIVQVPAPRMLATILIEKFHRFETGMLVSICLWMVAWVAPGAILMTLAVRRGAD